MLERDQEAWIQPRNEGGPCLLHIPLSSGSGSWDRSTIAHRKAWIRPTVIVISLGYNRALRKIEPSTHQTRGLLHPPGPMYVNSVTAGAISPASPHQSKQTPHEGTGAGGRTTIGDAEYRKTDLHHPNTRCRSAPAQERRFCPTRTMFDWIRSSRARSSRGAVNERGPNLSSWSVIRKRQTDSVMSTRVCLGTPGGYPVSSRWKGQSRSSIHQT